ncbi:MAG: CHRD domain-containing protein [Candidatus Promineifilaceae bacterium]|nr:CHRD domain-containing protein [Candidatus Promineifilaceae bacterium]
MKRTKRGILVLITTIVALAMLIGISSAAGKNTYTASLKGRNEVPPAETQGQGESIVRVNKDGSALNYKLIVANIDNVTQSHIHCGPEGANGPVVAFLFGFVSGGVTVNGVLAEGTITAEDVISRPDSDSCPGGVADLDDLIQQIRSGNTYVNVHTVQVPSGEIRGQLN